MDRYVTGAVIKRLRESKKLTQEDLAGKIFVSSKAVSKWETGQGFPDITLLEPLAKALDISMIELFSGDCVKNANKASNITKCKFYVCPICGNVIWTIGDAVISCCGLTLPPLEPEAELDGHTVKATPAEDEFHIQIDHPMTKEHYISFIAAVSDDGVQIAKLYPESNAEARFKRSRVKHLYAYCNRHGLFR